MKSVELEVGVTWPDKLDKKRLFFSVSLQSLAPQITAPLPLVFVRTDSGF